MAVQKSLRRLITGAMAGVLSEREIGELAHIFRILAVHHLERKHLARSGMVHRTGMSLGDVALDCLADVFRRDSAGRFVEFIQFFESRSASPDDMSDEMLLSCVRELVFRKLNDSIFRIYNEIDPATGKILRNLKLAIEKSTVFRIVERFGELHLVPPGDESDAHLEPLTPEELEDQIVLTVAHDRQIPTILNRFGSWLIGQEHYQRSVRLCSLAVAIRIAFEKAMGPLHVHEDSPEEALLFHDTMIAIRQVCEQLLKEFAPRYVGKGRVDAATFAGYRKAIEGVLLADFLDEGTPLSYFEHLRKENPAMTHESYMTSHRTIFEYLTKLGKERTRMMLKYE